MDAELQDGDRRLQNGQSPTGRELQDGQRATGRGATERRQAPTERAEPYRIDRGMEDWRDGFLDKMDKHQ